MPVARIAATNILLRIHHGEPHSRHAYARGAFVVTRELLDSCCSNLRISTVGSHLQVCHCTLLAVNPPQGGKRPRTTKVLHVPLLRGSTTFRTHNACVSFALGIRKAPIYIPIPHFPEAIDTKLEYGIRELVEQKETSLHLRGEMCTLLSSDIGKLGVSRYTRGNEHLRFRRCLFHRFNILRTSVSVVWTRLF